MDKENNSRSGGKPRRVPGVNRAPAENPAPGSIPANSSNDIYARSAQRRQNRQSQQNQQRKHRKRRRRLNPRFIIACIVVLVLLLALIFGIARLVHNGKDKKEASKQSQTQVQEEKEEKKPFFGSNKKNSKETEPPTEPPTQPPMEIQQTATVSATGDVLMHMPVIKSGYDSDTKTYDFTEIFQYIDDYAAKADYAVANLETTLAGSGNGYKYSGYPCFNCPDSITDALKEAGFDMLLTVNNHCYDTRTTGLKRTLEVAAEAGLDTLGTQAESADPDYAIEEVNGIKIGMLCYSYATSDNDPDRPSMNGILVKAEYADKINYFDTDRLDAFYEEVSQQIMAMKLRGAEAVVMYIHWGQEYQRSANSTQKAMAQKLCDLGVDVIVGGHPHVVQPVELLTSTLDQNHKTVCLYSMGNAVSNQRRDLMTLDTGHTEDGLLFSFTFAKYTDGEVLLDSVDILPTWVYMKKGSTNSYRILPLDKEVSDWASAYNISSSAAESAQKSYERTMKLVGEGLIASNTFLTSQREAKLLEKAEPLIRHGVN